jgi:hypothetical protein
MNPNNQMNQMQNMGWQGGGGHNPLQPVGFRCPYCQSPAGTYAVSKVSTGGWVVLVVMLLFCLPLFWIGLLIREDSYHCRSCLMRLS